MRCIIMYTSLCSACPAGRRGGAHNVCCPCGAPYIARLMIFFDYNVSSLYFTCFVYRNEIWVYNLCLQHEVSPSLWVYQLCSKYTPQPVGALIVFPLACQCFNYIYTLISNTSLTFYNGSEHLSYVHYMVDECLYVQSSGMPSGQLNLFIYK